MVRSAPAFVLFVELAEVGHTPPAPGPCAEAFGDERGDGRVLTLHVGADLAEGHVMAEADLVVFVHPRIIGVCVGR